ncbi:PRC-barrel domain-containing protein [Yoonia sp.]|uniref:PRC-barrel domain-containing protein n=1 Tax=Yoonia sp. TaxID=2212373 RepID=UPI00391A0ACD
MKTLMLTTALVAATSMGAFAQTEATAPGAEAEMTQTAGATVPAFLASNFTGMSLYTLDTDETRTLNEARMAQDRNVQERNRMRWDSGATFAGARDSWENVGNIDDVILSQDGELRGVLLDVGGFLGIGARTVMVDLDDLYFVADDTTPEDLNDFFVVATMSRDQLETLPEWDENQLTAGFAERSYNDAGVQTGTAVGTDQAGQPGMQADGTDQLVGYEPMTTEQLTAERVLGANVYDTAGDNIATVDDLVMGADGEITHAVMDVGGFLGLGSYTVALDVSELDILWSEDNQDVRVQVSMTQEQLETLPEYEG